jgi:hypothetical protein
MTAQPGQPLNGNSFLALAGCLALTRPDISVHLAATGAGSSALDVATFRMNAERLADRGVERLRDPLLLLASTAAELTENTVPDQAALTTAYLQDQVPKDMHLHVIQRQAVLQDRTARDLTEQIASTWHTLRAEWGS